MSASLPSSSAPAQPARPVSVLWQLLPLAALVCVLLWSHAPTLRGLMADWKLDDNYSVGQLVPFAAVYILWGDRKRIASARISPCLWGLAVLLLAEAVRHFGLLAYFPSIERYAMVLAFVGVVLLAAGADLFRRIFWVLMFLFLMVPLPVRVHNAISGPLQDMASRGAVIVLELIGITVTREGNVLMLNNHVSVAVAEACSGLRMLTAFVVVAAVLAFVIHRPTWQKVVLVLSSVPVAIVCNLVRLVATSVLYLVASSEIAERFFHDFAGWTMMPMAVFILVGELWLMARIVTEEPHGPVQTRL